MLVLDSLIEGFGYQRAFSFQLVPFLCQSIYLLLLFLDLGFCFHFQIASLCTRQIGGEIESIEFDPLGSFGLLICM